jgi:two-component system sensor histidine kinase HydH
MIIKAALRSLKTPEVTPDDVKAAVSDIDEEVTRLNRIVSEVLDFARPIKFDLTTVDINALCADAAHATASDDEGIRIQLDLEERLPSVTTDGERLRIALVNILSNAQHAAGAAGGQQPGKDAEFVRLRTRRQGADRIAIEVRDHGTGIAPDDLPRVFDPYFTTRRTGTGLGLAISRNIVEGLGGVITVSSQKGRGTEVRIELPL